MIPCGDYVFDHRNASVREWLVNEVMLGLGHIVTLHHRPPTSHHPDSLTHPAHLFLTGQRGRTSQVMLGPMGLAHPAVDGFGCIDDWYAGIARVLRGDRGRPRRRAVGGVAVDRRVTDITYSCSILVFH